jgi:hypothetical protein
MADKSQRNQFKKKVTTCPLLLSLFLLGANAAVPKTYSPKAEVNIGIDDEFVVAAATAEFY